jgi:hypothetical protein
MEAMMRDAVRYVLFYDMGPAGMEMAQQLFPAHQKWFEEFMRRGVLLSLGRFADGDAGAMAMGVFTSREAAEEFVAADPFVLNEVVGNWRVREWRTANAE